MDLRSQLQAIKAENAEKMRLESDAERQTNRRYHQTLAKHIVKAVLEKRVNNDNSIRIFMRMDRKRKFWLEEVNLLLRDHYVRIRQLQTHSTELNSCIINPCCIFCCPCIFLPKIVVNTFLGTVYEVNVVLDL